MSLFGCDDEAMGEGDGVYYSGSAYSGSDPTASASDRRSARRRAKKALVAVVGLSAVGGGAYFGTTLLTGNAPGYVSGGPAALAPAASATTASIEPTVTSAPDTPSPGPQIGTKSGVRQSARPSPTPSEPALTDDEVAAAQVSRLLQASPPTAATGMTIASGPVTVSDETGTDGSAIRVVVARYDLAARWAPADRGRAVGDARCTQKLQTGLDPTPQPRPNMLMCWRTAAGKSVVTVAINQHGKPLDAASLDVLDRQWHALG
jgi:hypothetical protein